MGSLARCYLPPQKSPGDLEQGSSVQEGENCMPRGGKLLATLLDESNSEFPPYPVDDWSDPSPLDCSGLAPEHSHSQEGHCEIENSEMEIRQLV